MRISKHIIPAVALCLCWSFTSNAQNCKGNIVSRNLDATKNITSFSPLPLVAFEGATYFGLGIEYDRFLNRKKQFSTNLALYAGMIGLQPQHGKLFAMSPGILYHPQGNKRRLDFAFGPQLFLGREKYSYFND